MPEPLSPFIVAVVTVSDRVHAGEREDLSGPILAQAMRDSEAQVVTSVIPDGIDSVREAIEGAVANGARVVITTGGTGIGPRDFTPEGTALVIDRAVPGLAERLRAVDADAVPGAVLSRGLAGITSGNPGALVVNVPGSASAARSAARILMSVVPHALAQLAGQDH